MNESLVPRLTEGPVAFCVCPVGCHEERLNSVFFALKVDVMPVFITLYVMNYQVLEGTELCCVLFVL